MAKIERFCITGTAGSWVKTPWTDQGLHIASLNDAYRMKGFVRADSWFDLHPLNKFIHIPEGTKQVYAHQIPAGHYVRPSNHLEWLSKQSIPVWLSRPEDHHPAESYELPTWPHLKLFPKREIEAAFGQYFTSSPAWMLAQAVLNGAKEIHIYGIHLATEHEYIEQRPNFEFLIGRVLGPSRIKTTIKDGLRRYETKDGMVVLPVESPILDSDFQYAFQARPRAHLEPLKWDLHRFGIKRERAIQQLRTMPFWKPRKPVTEDLMRLDALIADTQERMGQMQLAADLARAK